MAQTDNPLSSLVFRCYKPMDEELTKRAKVELQSQSPWAGWLDQLREEDARLASLPAEDKVTLVPRKPNWDLKRDAAKKVDKLERATQRAVADIIRRKLAGETTGAVGGSSSAASKPPSAAVAVASAGGLEHRADSIDSAALARAMEGMARVGGGEEEGEGEGVGGEGTDGVGRGGRAGRTRYDSEDEEEDQR